LVAHNRPLLAGAKLDAAMIAGHEARQVGVVLLRDARIVGRRRLL
jgi:hypothetical protein